MNNEEIRLAVLRVLTRIAPEADPAQLRPDISIREQLDIDSMDFLNFVIGLHEAFQIDIPEVDYPKLLAIDDCVKYVAAAAGSQK